MLSGFREGVMFGWKAWTCLILDSLLPVKLAEAEFGKVDCLRSIGKKF